MSIRLYDIYYKHTFSWVIVLDHSMKYTPLGLSQRKTGRFWFPGGLLKLTEVSLERSVRHIARPKISCDAAVGVPWLWQHLREICLGDPAGVGVDTGRGVFLTENLCRPLLAISSGTQRKWTANDVDQRHLFIKPLSFRKEPRVIKAVLGPVVEIVQIHLDMLLLVDVALCLSNSPTVGADCLAQLHPGYHEASAPAEQH